MKFYLPSMEECLELVENSEVFYMSERIVEGQKVRMMDYRLAGINDFFQGESNWTELRGLTFVQLDDGTWERNILMNKFFNIGQCPGWNVEDVKDKKITRIQNKEDGSIVSFVRFSNGVTRAKSKMSFESEQAENSQQLYNINDNIKNLVHWSFDNNITLIWELCGPDNQIVLEYDFNKLVLLQARYNSTGEYINLTEINTGSCHLVQEFTFSLEELLEMKETSQEDIEGWVVTFEDSQMAKIKTNKYLLLHGLIGPDAFRENILIKTILDGNIDDLISSLVPGVKRDRILDLTEKVDTHFNHLVVEFKELRRKYFQDFQEIRKDFAIKHSRDRLFSYVMKTLNTSFRDVEKTAESSVKEYILRECNSLGKAKSYLEKL